MNLLNNLMELSLKEYLGIDIWKKILRIRRDLMLDDVIPRWREEHIRKFNHMIWVYMLDRTVYTSLREGLKRMINPLSYDDWICPFYGSKKIISNSNPNPTRRGPFWFYGCNKH